MGNCIFVLGNEVGNEIQTTHSRHRYYREFAYIPAKNDGFFSFCRIRASPVQNDKGLKLLLKTFSNQKGMYISVYDYSKLDKKGRIIYESAKIDRVYLDFDCEDSPQDAIDEALLVIRALTSNKIYPHCYFSGNKGIAMYIEFITVDIADENKKPVITEFYNLVKSMTEEQFSIKLKTLDTQVRGDIARVSRLPNTKHASGHYCIPLTIADIKQGVEHIKELAQSPRIDYDLEDEIITGMMKNQLARRMIINLEKKVIAKRWKEKHEKELKKHKIATHFKINGKQSSTISDDDIETAKAHSLSDLISSDSKIVCPFHPDTQPSLSIDHERGLWHCFGCGKGGTAIDYVMERDNLCFVDAVKKLL